MSRRLRYLTHPQVSIDPDMDIRRWSLSVEGLARIERLAASGALAGTRVVISSDEVKAVEAAACLAEGLGVGLMIRPDMHENDRSATGFLPPARFEARADAFFARPDESEDGWETAIAAQARILAATGAALARAPAGDVLIVGHGAVGTLLYCHLAAVPISRRHDQPAGGGCFFDARLSDGPGVTRLGTGPLPGWRQLESLLKTA